MPLPSAISSSASSRSSSPLPESEPQLPSNQNADPSVESKVEKEEEEEVDVPVLSHAAARKAKKEAKKALKSSSAAVSSSKEEAKKKPTKEKKEKKGSKDVVPRDKFPTVWIGNLAFSTTSEDLRKWLEGKCEELLEDSEGGGDGVEDGAPKGGWVVSLRMPKGERGNKGFAHASFKTAEAHALCLKLSESTFQGRRLLIKDAENFDGRPDPKKDAVKRDGPRPTADGNKKVKKDAPANDPSPTLFVGNLGFETTSEELQSMFDLHAEKEKDAGIRKGKCKGFAFVDFHSTDGAAKALANQKNWLLAGRRLNLQYAGEDAVRRGNRSPRKHGRDTQEDGERPAKKSKREHEESGRGARRMEANQDGEAGPANVGEAMEVRREKSTARGATKGVEKRKKPKPTPGSALALAKRESYAIVESQGKKVVFD
ncbi:hypothetical protein BT69DRAFT_1286542 [Atractiella rhizophila]|nr:hypothetical protein BT69DRAFT_1286542 [Atractiella rhizophila]